MPVTASNGTVISATEVQWECSKYTGMYLYCAYTKGTEASIDITFTVTDDTEPTSGAFNLVEIATTTGVATAYNVNLSASINAVVPITLPACADKVNAIFTFNTPGGTPGTIVVFANMNDIYR